MAENDKETREEKKERERQEKEQERKTQREKKLEYWRGLDCTPIANLHEISECQKDVKVCGTLTHYITSSTSRQNIDSFLMDDRLFLCTPLSYGTISEIRLLAHLHAAVSKNRAVTLAGTYRSEPDELVVRYYVNRNDKEVLEMD